MLNCDELLATITRPSAGLRGETDLWVAVLQQAVADLGDKDRAAATLQWFASGGAHPGAFVWICNTLQLEASWVRARVLQVRPTPAPTTPTMAALFATVDHGHEAVL